jgi:hypothetical protein
MTRIRRDDQVPIPQQTARSLPGRAARRETNEVGIASLLRDAFVPARVDFARNQRPAGKSDEDEGGGDYEESIDFDRHGILLRSLRRLSSLR